VARRKQITDDLPDLASVGFMDYSYVDVLDVWYKSVNFALKMAGGVAQSGDR